MYNFGSATPGSTSFLAQSTPINQTRSASGFLFNSTATQPSTLTSTPFGSTTLFGGATPAATSTTTSTGTGTIHKFDAVLGTDKINKNGIQTQIRTKIFNVCAMPVYEKKSMEELRFEDYVDNRKFASATTTAATSLFPSTATSSSLFSGSTTLTNPTTSTSNIFGNKTATTTATSSSPFTFGASTAPTTATASPFTFGAPAATATTTTSAAATPFSFGAPATTSTATSITPFGSTTTAPAASTSLFSFGSSQPQPTATTTTPALSFGGTTATSSLFPTASTATTSTPFGFSTSRPATVPTFSFTSSTTAPAATAAPTLFSAAAPTNPTPILTTQSSVDTRTHLQLFQTMLNIQPFNSELGFLARNIKPNIGLDRTRLRTAPDSATINPINNVFSPLLTKPSVLPSTTTTTPPSSLINALPTHPHTVPTVLLPSSSAKSSLGLFGKRKLADSFLDDDDDNSLMMDDGPSSIHKLPKVNAIKRPRVLDMNKIRSIVLGGGGGSGGHNESLVKDENLSETFVVKTTSENVSGWKKFATYDAYLASKKPQLLEQPQSPQIRQEEKPMIINHERAFRLPQLTHDDYYTKPTIDELRNYFDEHGQCFVNEFTVGREHYGSVTFQGSKINLTGLDLNELIEIGRRQVTVYPDDKNKPKEGEEFNCPAVISLLGVYPIDRSASNSGEEITDPERLIDMNYGNYLREMTKKFQGQFIDYDVYSGTWTFKVDHF